MTVKTLITLLLEQDMNANVVIVVHDGKPIECDVKALVCREDIDKFVEPLAEVENVPDAGARDLCLVPGRQLRGGSRLAWEWAQGNETTFS